MTIIIFGRGVGKRQRGYRPPSSPPMKALFTFATTTAGAWNSKQGTIHYSSHRERRPLLDARAMTTINNVEKANGGCLRDLRFLFTASNRGLNLGILLLLLGVVVLVFIKWWVKGRSEVLENKRKELRTDLLGVVTRARLEKKFFLFQKINCERDRMFYAFF